MNAVVLTGGGGGWADRHVVVGEFTRIIYVIMKIGFLDKSTTLRVFSH